MNSPAEPAPCQDLYIYYLQGRLSAEPSAGNEFLGNWEEDDFSFLFFSEPADTTVARVLADQPDLVLLDQFRMSYEEWQGGRLAPFTAGGFTIVPPWQAEIGGPETSRILLDPGVVFGTGTHPTTRDCLEMIARVFDTSPPGTVLDLGTGTGLLAIAAALQGSRRVLALDLNRLAVRTTQRNIHLNGLADRVLAVQGRAGAFAEVSADLLVANIHYDVMARLLEMPGFLRRRWFVLSGLLRSEASAVERRLNRLPVEIVERRTPDGVWHTFLGRSCP